MIYAKTKQLLVTIALVAICHASDGKAQQHKTAIVRHAELPLYPPIAWTTNTSGSITLRAIVNKGAVTSVDVEKTCTNCLDLEQGAMENAKTWTFAEWINEPITITYDFKIIKSMKDDETFATVQVGSSIHVIINAAPSKPTTLY